MSEFNSEKLQELVDAEGAHNENYETALNYCRQALAVGHDCQFWLAQIGYLCFEGDQGKYLLDTSSIFRTLCTIDPTDLNARFWLGYAEYIIWNRQDVSEYELRTVLKRDPDHPYANLILSDFVDANEKVELLNRVLAVQKTNRRAYQQLAMTLIELRDFDQAIALLEVASSITPYVELKYGVINGYVNSVLTGANDPWWRDNMETLLEKAKKPPRRSILSLLGSRRRRSR